MSLALVNRKAALLAPWNKNELWRRARAVPSLDLRFADNKSLVDATTGQNLISFTRASSGTYVDSQSVIRTATTNLLLQSADISNAYWVKAETTVTANAITAPDGTTTAGKLVESINNTQHTLASAAISWAGNTQYTATFFAKAGERSKFDILLGTGTNWVNSERVATFDLASGTVVFSPNSPAVASITPFANNWFRCRVTATTTATPSASSVFIRMCDNTGLASYQGIANYGLYLWGAQLEQSSTVGEYIPTTSTINSAPRFDHNPTTGESLGLLVEESRTNLSLNTVWAGGVTPTSWTAQFAGAPSVTTSNLGNADGGVALSFTCSASRDYLIQTVAVAANTTYTFSVYVESTDQYPSASANIIAIANGPSGSTITGAVGNPANKQRIFCSIAVGATAGNAQLRVGLGVGSNATGTIVLSRPQLEAGAFPTSYIPTTTATVTRSADVASISGSNFSSWYRQDEGTVYGDYIGVSNISGGTRRLVEIGISGNTNDRIVVGYGATSLARLLVVVGGISQADLTPSVQQGLTVKLAAAFAANDFQLATNSSLSSVDSVGSVPSVSALSLGADFPGAANTNLNGTIRRLCFWPKRLLASSLAAITQ